MIAIYLAQYYMLSCLLNWRYALSSDRTIQVGSNSVAVKPQFDKYVGSIVQAGGELDKEPEEVVLSRAGLQIPQGKYVLIQEGGDHGLQAQVLQILGAVAHVQCSGVLGPHRGTGGTTGDLPQWLP